jgi:hypothetical protein
MENLKRMNEIGIARGTLLGAMHLHGIDIGAIDQVFIRTRVIGLDPLDKLILAQHPPVMGPAACLGNSASAA